MDWRIIRGKVERFTEHYEGPRFHALLCDAPYEMAFMGKSWDASGVSFNPETWRGLAKHLLPGAFLFVMAGTVNDDLISVAMREAGLRKHHKMLGWVYGSGFPKSTRIDTQIDKAAGRLGKSTLQLKREIRGHYELTGLTLAQFNEACGFEASGYLRESSTWATVLPSREKWERIKEVIGCDGSLDALFEEAEREVIGKSQWTNSAHHFVPGEDHSERVQLDITAPATPLAAAWQGHRYGLQALKPAIETVLVFQKPYEGKPVESITRTGAGALWIDGARIATDWDNDPSKRGLGYGFTREGNQTDSAFLDGVSARTKYDITKGRWPANFFLVHVNLPVMRICGRIPPKVETEIRRYFNGYDNLSAMRERRGIARLENQARSEVLRRGLRGRITERKDPARFQAWEGKANLPPMWARVRGLEGVDQAWASKVLQLGLQDGIPKDLDGRAQFEAWNPSHRRSERENEASTTAQGQRCSSVERRQVPHEPGLQIHISGQLEARDKGINRTDGNQSRLCVGASDDSSDGVRTSTYPTREGSPHQRQQDRQSNSELADIPCGRTFETTPGDRQTIEQVAERERTTKGGKYPLEVLACDIPRQWLEYFELTSENLGCRRVGTTRVKSDRNTARNPVKKSNPYHLTADNFDNSAPTAPWGYADSDGLETITAWDCHPDCPARRLGEQSGLLQSGALSPQNNVKPSSGWAGGSYANRVKSTFEPNSGTAARFFFQADWQLEQSDPVLYCPKASRGERDAGLNIPPQKNRALMQAQGSMMDKYTAMCYCATLTPPSNPSAFAAGLLSSCFPRQNTHRVVSSSPFVVCLLR